MISVVIPHMPIGKSDEWLAACVRSLPAFVGETIIIVNNGEGYAKAVNRGLALAKGDYLIVATNDTEWQFGKLENLCDPKAIVAPLVNGQETQWACFFGMPRRLYEVVGGFDEHYQLGYYEDNDYGLRVEKAGFGLRHTRACLITHGGGRTMAALGAGVAQDAMRANLEYFQKKWGRSA